MAKKRAKRQFMTKTEAREMVRRVRKAWKREGTLDAAFAKVGTNPSAYYRWAEKFSTQRAKARRTLARA